MTSETRPGRGWVGLILVLVLALYGWTSLSASEGRPVAPLDDAYIHFQYARQIAQGHPWQYNDGDPPSTGATSPVYPFLLAAAYRMGFSGERLVWFALGLGIVSLGLSAWLVFRITGRLVAPLDQRRPALAHWAPASAACFFLLTGAIQWAYWSGMESGPFTVLVLAALDAFLTQPSPAAARASLWVAAAALTRPEGLIMAGVLWLVIAGQGLRAGWSGGWRARVLSLSQRIRAVSLAVLIGSVPFLLNAMLTGSPIATGAQAKSWSGNVPFRLLDIVRSILGNYRRILEQFTAGLLAPQPWFLAPGVLLLAGVGWIALLRRRKWDEVTLTMGWFVLGTLATASLITATWHVGRYLVPFLALLTPLAALGLVVLADGCWVRAPTRDNLLQGASNYGRAFVVVGLALGLLVATLLSTFQARALYQRAVSTVTRQQLAVADWIHCNLSPDARVGVHDTGAIRYVSERATYDMIGLTTQGAATAWRHGAGAVFERMENSPARPDYFATYPDVFSLPYLAATDLFSAELFRAEVPDFAVASAGPAQAVYQADWRLASSGDRLYQTDVLRRTRNLTLVDRLDLADLEDEASHDLTFWEGQVRPGFPTEVQQFRYRTDPAVEVLDGGRLVTGGLAFRVATGDPHPTDASVPAGRPVLLIARLHAAEAGSVRVIVDGRDVGRWRYPALPGEWLETAFLVPAEAVTQDNVVIRLQVDTADAIAAHFAPYHLWVWQGAPEPFVPEPARPLSARLGDAVELIGYDLPARSFRPGETVSLVLYWRAVGALGLADDVKVFVHLYDGDGEIVTQQDHRPYYGTRPLYTWSWDEALDDPYDLVLPPDLPAGRYTLAVGMYDATSSVRLPVTVAADHKLSDNRIALQPIDVVPNR